MSIADDTIARDVREYAVQVRAALADLGPESVDDLTDGLEANLADALADDGRAHGVSLADEFGAPDVYAAELRAAAGLAPAGGPGRRESAFRTALLSPWRDVRAGALSVLADLRRTRWFPGVEELVRELRPAWWVLRGWALAHLLLRLVDAEQYPFWVPATFGGWVLLLVSVVASAQWGRGRWRTGPRWGRVLRAANGVLALTAVILLLSLPGAHRNDVAWAENTAWHGPDATDGVVVGGERADNLFVYDAEGRPVEGAQVFDQDGRPVTTEADPGVLWAMEEHWPDGADEPLLRVGVPGANGQTRWNVFPLHSALRSAWGEDGTLDVTDPDLRDGLVAPSWPFAAAAPVVVWQQAEGDPGPTPAPSGRATPTPSADPSPAPSDASVPEGAEGEAVEGPTGQEQAVDATP